MKPFTLCLMGAFTRLQPILNVENVSYTLLMTFMVLLLWREITLWLMGQSTRFREIEAKSVRSRPFQQEQRSDQKRGN